MDMREKLALRARGVKQSGIRAVTRQIEAVNGVNLGQGTCELSPAPEILRAAEEAIAAGHNAYTFFDGIPELKEGVAARYRAYNNLPITADNVVITGGATGGLECICKCFLEVGDEVILFEPIYQYHVSLVRERQALPRLVPLRPGDWSFDPADLEMAFSERTKLLVLANPNNPTGKVFTREELLAIGDACRRHNVIAVTDEVYEYILFDDKAHLTLASLPGMFDHCLTLSSASKTLFVTGWRVGWMVGPTSILEPLGVKSDETYVCAPAPLQHAVAFGLRLGEDFFANIRRQFAPRREMLLDALRQAGFRPSVPAGAYYVLADYRELGLHDDVQAMKHLIVRAAVGAVAGRSFFPSVANTGLLRFCFALTDDRLAKGCELLTSTPLHL
jgi:aminotransferase